MVGPWRDPAGAAIGRIAGSSACCPGRRATTYRGSRTVAQRQQFTPIATNRAQSRLAIRKS
ncbi:hypothetical protein FrEUN1fDRAFT_3024 [Parafrankia sp. EUN1f]|nr:hypothetical protein FrEUN1fDRAFT_3024 [Parafrankia sp. EUN1f]